MPHDRSSRSRRRQRRLRDPLFDLALLADQRIAVALASVLLVGIGLVGTAVLVSCTLVRPRRIRPAGSSVGERP